MELTEANIYTANKGRLIGYAEYVEDTIINNPGESILLYAKWLFKQEAIEAEMDNADQKRSRT